MLKSVCVQFAEWDTMASLEGSKKKWMSLKAGVLSNGDKKWLTLTSSCAPPIRRLGSSMRAPRTLDFWSAVPDAAWSWPVLFCVLRASLAFLCVRLSRKARGAPRVTQLVGRHQKENNAPDRALTHAAGRQHKQSRERGQATPSVKRRMEHVKRRCQAVLSSIHPISSELRAAAVMMLNTGEPSKRARVATGTYSHMPSAAMNPAPALAPISSESSSAESSSASDWACPKCTLLNSSVRTHCRACQVKKHDRMPFIPSDDDDADAFAAPAARKKKPAAAPAASGHQPKPLPRDRTSLPSAAALPRDRASLPSAAAPASAGAPPQGTSEEPVIVSDDDDDEWDDAVGAAS